MSHTTLATLHTSGDGYWSREKRGVRIVEVDMAYVGESCYFGELRVKFDVADWDVSKHGLIYTDSQWLRELRKYLLTVGFTAREVELVSYSEQGMQGDNYVSLDVCEEFIAGFKRLYPQKFEILWAEMNY